MVIELLALDALITHLRREEDEENDLDDLDDADAAEVYSATTPSHHTCRG